MCVWGGGGSYKIGGGREGGSGFTPIQLGGGEGEGTAMVLAMLEGGGTVLK